MQEPRRRRRMEQHLLPLGAALASFLFACAPRPSAAPLAQSPAAPGGEPRASASGEGVDAGELTPASATSGGTASPATGQGPTATASSNPAPDPTSYGFPKDTLILHVGDSFAGSLGVPLGK